MRISIRSATGCALSNCDNRTNGAQARKDTGQPFCVFLGFRLYFGQVAAFVLGDLTTLQIETTDLAEADVSKVKVGAAARVTFDDFPGKTFQGTVTHVAPVANDHSGDKVFKVTVGLVCADLAELKWGMKTNVEIGVGQGPN
jgi:hypothetical protein